MRQILFILGNVFGFIDLINVNFAKFPELYIYCINYKKISKDHNEKLLDIFSEWTKLNPGWSIKLKLF